MSRANATVRAKRTGRMTKDKFGFSMPVDAPSYVRPPSVLKNVESVIITYETDSDAAADLLPAADELELPDITTARIVCVQMPHTPWGAYDEVYQLIDCTWEGKPCIFPVRLLVNSDVGMMIGRELWGNPKKFGIVEFRRESNIIQCIGERPRGTRLVTALMQCEQSVEVEVAMVDVLGFRVIPNPEKTDEFSIAELLINPQHVTTHLAYKGRSNLTFDTQSNLDPWYRLPVKEIVDSIYTITDIRVSPTAKIVKKF